MRYYLSNATHDGFKRIKPIDDFNCEYFIEKDIFYYFGFLMSKLKL
jgi:hypothetical protein